MRDFSSRFRRGRRSSGPAEFAVIGDLMLECINGEVEPGKDVNYGGRELTLGGHVLNVTWHLTRNLGRRSALISFIDKRDYPRLKKYKDAGIELMVIPQSVATDLLALVMTNDKYLGVYIPARVPESTYEDILGRWRGSKCIVLNGSRHGRLRSGFVDVASSANDKAVVAFNPAYAVSEYETNDLISIIEASHFTILNKLETEVLCDRFQVHDAEELSKRFDQTCIVTTREHDGAEIYRAGHATHIESMSGVVKNALGAGDAFLAGLLAEKLNDRSDEDAGDFAAALAARVVRSGLMRPEVTQDEVREHVMRHKEGRDR